MSAVADLVLKRFAVLYGEPNTNNLEAYFAEYERALECFYPEVLTKACDLVIATHEFKFWPTVGECAKAARKINGERVAALERARPRPAEPAWTEPTPEEAARMDVLLLEARQKLAADSLPEPQFALKPVDRLAMQALQRAALRTKDGRDRHLRRAP